MEYNNSYSQSPPAFVSWNSFMPVLRLNTKCRILFISILECEPLVCFVPESGDIEHQSCICAVAWNLVMSFVCCMTYTWLLSIKNLMRLNHLNQMIVLSISAATLWTFRFSWTIIPLRGSLSCTWFNLIICSFGRFLLLPWKHARINDIGPF